MVFILLLELNLLVFPVIGLSLYKPLNSNQNYQRTLIYLAILVSIILGLRFFNISLKGDISDFFVISLAYLLYVSSVPFLKRIKNKIFRIAAFFFAYIPIVLGYLLGTVGAFGIALFGIDAEADEIARVNENVAYRTYKKGFSFTSGRTDYEFYKSKEISIFEEKLVSFTLRDDSGKNEEQKVKLKESKLSYHIKIITNTETLIDTLILK